VGGDEKEIFFHLFYFYKSLELYILTCVRGFVGQQEGFFFLKGRSDLFFLDNPVIIGQTEVFFSLLLYLGKDTRKSIRKIKKFPQYKEKNSVARLQSIRTGNIYSE
jgi:hypothetical protein